MIKQNKYNNTYSSEVHLFFGYKKYSMDAAPEIGH